MRQENFTVTTMINLQSGALMQRLVLNTRRFGHAMGNIIEKGINQPIFPVMGQREN